MTEGPWARSRISTRQTTRPLLIVRHGDVAHLKAKLLLVRHGDAAHLEANLYPEVIRGVLGEYVEGSGRHRLDVLGTAGATGRGTMPPVAGARQTVEEVKTGPSTGQGGWLWEM